MAKLILEQGADYATLPNDSVIQVQVTEIKEKTVDGKNGKDSWMKLEFTFEILSIPDAMKSEYGSLVGSRIWGSVPARFSLHPDNKLRLWAEALLNMPLDTEGFELDTDVLLLRKARATTSSYEKRTGGKAHQVDGLLALTGGPAPKKNNDAAVLAAQFAADPWSTPTLQDDEPPF